MNLTLVGRRALVCGGSQGIGRASAFAIAELGASVTLVARNAETLAKVAGQLPVSAGSAQKHHWIAADFSNPASVRTIIADEVRNSDHHILVNNTGGPPAGRAIDADLNAYSAAFGAHVLCGQVLVQELLPGMQRGGYGRIINIISTSVKAPIPNLGVSNTIRGAVASWAKTLATELAPMGITVNNVLPGYTDTERLRALIQGRAASQKMDPEAAATELRKTVPMGRFARPEEVAAAVAFLASPAASYITGINVPVDGGRTPSL